MFNKCWTKLQLINFIIMTKVLNEENFKAESANGVVLIDFWAEWCGPCQQMLPLLDQFANEIWDKMTVAKVNVDENASIAAEYRVMSIPTLIVLKDGEMVEQMVWVQTVENLKEVTAKYL